MDEKFTFTPEEREQTLTILERLRTAVGNTFSAQVGLTALHMVDVGLRNWQAGFCHRIEKTAQAVLCGSAGLSITQVSNSFVPQ